MLKHLLLFQSFWFFLFNDVIVGGNSVEENSLTSKASLVRYWNKEISNESPIPEFLISKASPLDAVKSATFTKLAAENSLPTHLLEFCSAANLYCFPDSHLTKDAHNLQAIRFRTYRAIYRSQYAQRTGQNVKNKLVVEPGLFFRESMLRETTVISMPDIKDVKPKRSFLPQTIVSKLPFSTFKLAEMKRIFHAGENSTMERIVTNAVTDCQRTPSVGETKRCVGSAEDMIDLATSVLGPSVVLRTTDNAAGSNQKVVIGKVKVINGGKITKAVSCHQSLYPYLLYYCHSVPKVRVYEADLLELNSKTKINHGIAVCHVDTSSWDSKHMAFMALGSKPGRIEVCHWMFENEMNWTITDST